MIRSLIGEKAFENVGYRLFLCKDSYERYYLVVHMIQCMKEWMNRFTSMDCSGMLLSVLLGYREILAQNTIII